MSEEYLARYWHDTLDGRVQCDLCPRGCRMGEGQRGFCFVRKNVAGKLVLTTYGKTSGFAVDPIEKKPLNHFYPGSSVYSFGTAGCNLACRFCQNWEISTSRRTETLSARATPAEIAARAQGLGCRSVAYTYNDPIVFAEYAIDVALTCHGLGLANVAVSAGYVNPSPRIELFAEMDAANIDLKSFNPGFYRRITGGHLETVLDTLRFLVHETNVWTEITTLLIPGLNDSDSELGALTSWVAETLGPDIPMHFTAFHPDNRMLDVPRTPLSTLERARRLALGAGLNYVYTGNVRHLPGATTHCPGCQQDLIVRDGYAIKLKALSAGACPGCGQVIAGRW
ncbi:MAG: AmmeMemoRadiSam system radical SAM enzyme [Propionibacteriaceae bacterium]|jgi:pyruvate formate lyase activating enzyme|nr:AmmeMemoRadiSam system radical SAM enzyme [Propionibacteriaceae bacterium]